MNLTRDNKLKNEDVALDENTFGLDIGGLKGKTTRFKPLPMQSQITFIPQELLYLHEKAETSLNGLHANGKLFIASISHEKNCITSILTDGAEKKMLMKEADDIF